MDKCIKILKVAAYVGEVIVASSIIVEMIGKLRSRKAATQMAAAEATPENPQTNPA